MQASDVLDLMSKMSPVLVKSVDDAMSAAESSSKGVARALLDASGSDVRIPEIAHALVILPRDVSQVLCRHLLSGRCDFAGRV